MSPKPVVFSLPIFLWAACLNAQTFSVLHSLPDNASRPEANLILSDGVLYGTASSGTGDAGAVFSIGLDGGNFQVLHAFAVTQTDSAGVSTNADGADSVSPLVLDDDTLYGTTSEGGTNGSGAYFSYNLDTQVFTVLHTFGPQTNIGSDKITNVDGSAPNAGLLLLNNQLYGVTVNGGTNGAGLIFSLNLDGSGYTILHEFPKPWFFYDGITATYTNSEGFHPYGTLIASNGTLLRSCGRRRIQGLRIGVFAGY